MILGCRFFHARNILGWGFVPDLFNRGVVEKFLGRRASFVRFAGFYRVLVGRVIHGFKLTINFKCCLSITILVLKSYELFNLFLFSIIFYYYGKISLYMYILIIYNFSFLFLYLSYNTYFPKKTK